jgi:hypothetical protein
VPSGWSRRVNDFCRDCGSGRFPGEIDMVSDRDTGDVYLLCEGFYRGRQRSHACRFVASILAKRQRNRAHLQFLREHVLGNFERIEWCLRHALGALDRLLALGSGGETGSEPVFGRPDCEALYKAACAYAIASTQTFHIDRGERHDKTGRSRKQAERPSREQAERWIALSRGYGDRAAALLRLAVENGYWSFSELKTDKALGPLRQRADFQKLLAELEGKASASEPEPGATNR